MKTKLSDDQLDHMLRTLVRDASPSIHEIDQITDSPAIWWAIRRNIEVEKAAVAAAPWPPARWMRRVLTLGVPAIAAMAILISLLVWRASDRVQNDIAIVGVALPAVQPVEPNTAGMPEIVMSSPRSVTPTLEREIPNRINAKPLTKRPRPTTLPQEIKTEFIALSYARNPDSGQIVRVKVPSSMMVTLGLVSTVEKPTDLIDAEVVVGDDGLTRAIRFVR